MASDRVNGPIRLQLAGGTGLGEQEQTPPPPPAHAAPHSRFALFAFLGAVAISALWGGAAGGYLLGLFGSHGLANITVQQWAIFAVATFVPPLLFLALAWAIIRGQAMGEATRDFAEAADKIFAADETASRTAMRIGRAVRRELDALNAGLDTAFGRMHALEGQITNQIAALDDASSRLQTRGEAINGQLSEGKLAIDKSAEALSAAAAEAGENVAGRIQQMRGDLDHSAKALSGAAAQAGAGIAARMKLARAEMEQTGQALTASATEAGDALAGKLAAARTAFAEVSAALTASANQAGENVAGRVTQLKATIEAAGNVLDQAAGRLDAETDTFREATERAAEMPREVAGALDEQIKRIEGISEAAISRAEFVLNKQERHRAAMNDMLAQLKADNMAFEGKAAAERQAMEKILATLDAESKKFQALAGESERRIDAIMAAAATRTQEMARTFAREARGLKESGAEAGKTLAAMIAEVQEAGQMAKDLIGDAAGWTHSQSGELVDNAAEQCDRLMETAQRLSDETKALQAELAGTVKDVEKHITLLPDVAKEEAQKVREMVRQETEHMLDQSARTMATIHARNARGSTLNLERPLPPEESLGLSRLKRKIAPGSDKHPDLRQRMAAAPAKRQPTRPAGGPRPAKGAKSWEMQSLLSAVDGAEAPQPPSAAEALRTLENVFADMAVDLDAIAGDQGPQMKEWRRYLGGDRGVFARKLAAAIDGETVHRIAMLYREDAAFRDSADAYMEEFESVLSEVRDGVGGSLLASTMLSADTGKIYLAISYALGRL